MVAEDELLVLMGIEANLNDLGHEVVGKARNGVEAVNLALEISPDLILMDVNMPKQDGIEAIKKINKEKFIPSIIISAFYEKELIKRASTEGVFNYLVKPVDSNDLKAAIEVTMARVEEFKTLRNDVNDLKMALEARKYIEKAKGILMNSKNMKEPEAMKTMQNMSRNQNKKLVNIAKNIIELENLF